MVRRYLSLPGGLAHPLMMLRAPSMVRGAPSLRFLQEPALTEPKGRVTMLPTQLLWLCNQIAHAFQVPALCTVRKGRGTHYLVGASEVKSLGYPPINAGCRILCPPQPLRWPG